MFDRLSGFKDILWAVGIVLCLVLLFIGFVFEAVTPYHGEREPRTLSLDAAAAAKPTGEESSGGQSDIEEGKLRVLMDSADAGESYLQNAAFLCDSITIGLRDHALGVGTVWGSEAGNLPMSTSGTWSVLFTDGSKVSVDSACMITKPKMLYLCIGSDDLANVTQEQFVANYKALIASILTASPETKIVVCSIPPVAETYSSIDGLTSQLTITANSWVEQVATDTGVYFLRLDDAVRSGNALTPSYADANGKSLNLAGLNAVLDFVRTHAIPG